MSQIEKDFMHEIDCYIKEVKELEQQLAAVKTDSEVMSRMVDLEQENIKLKQQVEELTSALKGLYGRVSTDKDAKNWFKLEQMNAAVSLKEDS